MVSKLIWNISLRYNLGVTMVKSPRQLKNLALNECFIERQILRNWVTRCGPDGIRTRDLGLDRAAC